MKITEFDKKVLKLAAPLIAFYLLTAAYFPENPFWIADAIITCIFLFLCSWIFGKFIGWDKKEPPIAKPLDKK